MLLVGCTLFTNSKELLVTQNGCMCVVVRLKGRKQEKGKLMLKV